MKLIASPYSMTLLDRHVVCGASFAPVPFERARSSSACYLGGKVTGPIRIHRGPIVGNKYRLKPASQQEVSLYLFVGESVCAIQHLEDALSYSIVLKMFKPKTKSEAGKLLEKYQSYTLGQAIKFSKKENLYFEPLLKVLKELLADRNWLIHKSISHSRDKWDLNIGREKLIQRIKDITKRALEILQLIEEDLILFSEANGIDMSRVKAGIRKNYFEH